MDSIIKSPLKAIRQQCLYCDNHQYIEVKLCPVERCSLYLLRFGKRIKKISPLKAIRKKCFDCGEGTYLDIKNCEFAECALYQFRLGKNPFSRKKGNTLNLIPFIRKNSELSTQETENQGIVEAN